MGERPDDQVTTRVSTSGPAADNVSTSAADTTDESTETIKAEIEQTRSEMSDTIEAIQDRLSPARALDRAKDSVLEATVGRVKSAATRAGSSAGGVAGQTRDAASSAIERVRENPLPVALLGLGLAWIALRSRSSDQSSAAYGETDYAWAEPQWQAETEYGNLSRGQADTEYGSLSRGQLETEDEAPARGRAAAADSGSRSPAQSLWDVVSENPVPMAITAISIGWLVKNLRSRSDVDEWTYSDADDYSGSGAYAGSTSYVGSSAYDDAGLADDVSARPYDSIYTGSGSDYSGTYGGRSSGGTTEEGSAQALRRSQEFAGRASGAVRDAAQRGTERVSGIASQAGDVAGKAGESVREAARRGGERLGAIAGQASDTARRGGERLGVIASQAGETARRGGERLGVIAGQASEAARVAAQRGTERVSELARRGREGFGDMADRTQNQLDRMLQENPLALGLAAVAVGAAVGLSIPATEVENQYLGETRDQLLGKARGVAQQTAQQITSSVEQVAQNVKEQVSAPASDNPPA